MASFQERVFGALTLQVSTFEEVEHDASATGQAAAIVVLASLSSGLAWVFTVGITGLVSGAFVALVGWAIGATVVWLIGTRLLPGPRTEADIGQLLRTVGFAQAPALFSFLGVIPLLGRLLTFGIAIWGLVAWVIAVRQALDYDDTARAVIVCVLAWVAMVVTALLLSGLFGLGAAMTGRL